MTSNSEIFSRNLPDRVKELLSQSIFFGPGSDQSDIRFPFLSLSKDFNPEEVRASFLAHQGEFSGRMTGEVPISGYTGHLVNPEMMFTMSREAYDKFDFLSEQMNENSRLSAPSELYPRVIDSWNTREVADKIANIIYDKHADAYKSGMEDLTYSHIRDAYEDLSRDGVFDRPFVMRLSWIKGILGTLYPTRDLSTLRIFDSNAAGGEIFLAAALLKTDYTGMLFDDEGRHRLVDFKGVFSTFGNPDLQRIATFNEGYAPAKPAYRAYDVVMTSFTAFRDRGGHREGSFTDWFTWRVLGNMMKAWDALAIDGYMIFHTRDHDRYDVVDPLLLAIQQLFPKSSWVRMVALQDQVTGVVYGAYIFQKVEGVRRTIPIPEKLRVPEDQRFRFTFAYRYPELRDRYVELLMMNEIQEMTKETSAQTGIARETYNQAWGSIAEPLIDYAIQSREMNSEVSDDRKIHQHLFKILFSNNPWRLFPIITILERPVVYAWLDRVYAAFKG